MYSALTTIERKYYKEKLIDWIQPTLYSNGTLGGSVCAAYSSKTQYQTRYAYQVFDKDTTTIWTVTSLPVDLIFYSPKPINVTNIHLMNRTDNYNYTITAGTILGSNDNTNWDTLTSWTNSIATHGETWDIDLSSNTNFYKYYSIHVTAGTGNEASLAEATFTAKVMGYVEVTKEEDYDFYKDITKFTVPASIDTSQEDYYTVISYSTPGTYTITIEKTGNYSVVLVGGGGYVSGTWSPVMSEAYGYAVNYIGCGGGGGSFDGIISLVAGQYTVEVGESATSTILKDSNNNNIIVTYPGNPGYSSQTGHAGGTGGTIDTSGAIIISYNEGTTGQGTKGQSGLGAGNGGYKGGMSKYDPGYGHGNYVRTGCSNGGYFKINIPKTREVHNYTIYAV